MDIDYKKYYRDSDYIKYERLFRNIFRKRQKLIGLTDGRVLDIGCSNGVFLDLYKESSCETWGIEPSESGVEAKKKGHKVIREIFETAILPENYFDLVILNHTLEHMDNPLEVLKKVYRHLKGGGRLFIDVPNAGGLGSKILGNYWPYRLPDEHKWQFTRKSLSKIVREANFKITTFKSRSGIFEYDNPLLEFSRPRFIFDLITTPYSLLATITNMGDSMSMISKKI